MGKVAGTIVSLNESKLFFGDPSCYDPNAVCVLVGTSFQRNILSHGLIAFMRVRYHFKFNTRAWLNAGHHIDRQFFEREKYIFFVICPDETIF